MFSSSQDNPFFENPSSSSFLISFPTCLLNDEELLFDHLLHHQSPPLSVDATAVVPSSDKPAGDPILAAANPNSMDKDQGLGRHVIIAAEKKAKGKPQAEPPAVGKRKRVGGVKKQLGGGGAAPSARRRTGKKDRHSKIYTAQGPRDRRMRLSLQIARKFFDLQDMLGFDKASKTIEWLFAKSKAAIRELTASLPPHQRKGSLMLSSASLSSTSTTTIRIDKDDEKSDFGDVEGNNDQPKSSKSSCSNPTAKESREKARARARQRTMEKNKQKELMLERNPNNNSTNNTNNASKLGSSSTPESVDQEDDSGGYPSNQELNPTLEAIAFNSSQPQKSPVSIIEKLLGSDSSASSSSIYDECNYMGFAGNWVTDSLRMYPSYGAITGVDELQVILQQQNPKCVSSSPTGSSGMNSHQHCSISRGRNLL